MKTKFKILISTTLWAILILSGMVLLQSGPAMADEKAEAQQLVEKSKFTLQNFMKDPSMGVLRELMKDAKGVFIMPQLLRGAYVIGVSGGSGVFLAKEGNRWSGPAFYTVGGASIGLQIGGESSEVILVAMTDRGVAAFQSNSFKLGGDADIALGPVGAGISAQTANLSGDILSFSRSKGLYGGVSLQGAVVAARSDLNGAYYHEKVNTPADILILHKGSNPQAAGLLGEVAKAVKK